MLNPRQKYLQIALNRDLNEVASIISQIPRDNRIILEAGYPLIKTYGMEAIRRMKFWWNPQFYGTSEKQASFEMLSRSDFLSLFLGIRSKGSIYNFFKQRRFSMAKDKFTKKENAPFAPYIVADLKCMDRAFTEVGMAANAGASAVTCLGLAPVETINEFIQKCEEISIDSIIDMLNIEYPFEVLSKLARPPKIVMLHRGVDEGEENREKEIPYHEIARIKDVYDDILIAVAGGEKINEAISGAFNDADIIVVWRLFNENPKNIASVTNEFLREVK